MAEKDLGYVELEWTCPSCEARNPGSATKCKQCGASMPADTKFDLGAEEQLVTDKDKIAAAKAGPDIYCAYCGTRNAATAKVCRQCSAALAEGTARQAGGVVGAYSDKPALPLICPSCGAENKASALKCVKCGSVLGKPVTTPVASPAPATGRGCSPVLIAAVIIGVVAVIGAFIFFSTRSSDTVGQVADYGWKRTIALQALAPVEREAWRDQLPAGSDLLGCRERVFKVVDEPVDGAREVCGTPYIVDTGTGFGQKKQDRRYEVMADYCSYRTMAWIPAAPIVLEGRDLNPQWPSRNLTSNQRAGSQTEEYFIKFRANDRDYTYTTRSLDEYLRLAQGGQWKLTINGMGQITAISQ
jgi:ribosomal protein L40E